MSSCVFQSASSSNNERSHSSVPHAVGLCNERAKLLHLPHNLSRGRQQSGGCVGQKALLAHRVGRDLVAVDVVQVKVQQLLRHDVTLPCQRRNLCSKSAPPNIASPTPNQTTCYRGQLNTCTSAHTHLLTAMSNRSLVNLVSNNRRRIHFTARVYLRASNWHIPSTMRNSNQNHHRVR